MTFNIPATQQKDIVSNQGTDKKYHTIYRRYTGVS